MLPVQDKPALRRLRPIATQNGRAVAVPAGAEITPAVTRPAGLFSRPLVQAALVLLVCAAVYWPLLGRSGLSFTEGHRAVPAWEMLDTGEFLLPRMFERVYLRKPPGMSWAIALSSELLGRSEFAARAVSALAATASSLFVVFMSRRWFGPRAGLAAGLAHALTPLWWSPGRSAEIESLNNLGSQVAVMLVLDLLIRRPARPILIAIFAAAATILAGIAKGPTSLPCLAGALLAACAALGSLRALARRELLIVAGLPAIVLGLLTAAVYARVGTGQEAVTQSISDFLWNTGSITEVLTLVPVALVSAMPVSLALLVPWGREARAEYAPLPPHQSPYVIARALALTCLISLVGLAVLGVGNPRHAMPSLTCISPLVGYAFAGWLSGFTPRRTRDLRIMFLGKPWTWPVVLLIAAICFVGWSESRRTRISGKAVGEAIGNLLPDGCELWADGAVEARPEVLAYAGRRALADGRTVRPRWMPLAECPLPPDAAPVTFLLLRADALSVESEGYARSHPGSLIEVGSWDVYKYQFRLFRVNSDTMKTH